MSEKPSDKQLLFTPKELSAHWRVTVDTLQKWRMNNIGPVYIKIGGHIMYTRNAIKQYERQRMFHGTSSRVDETEGDIYEK